MEKPEDNVVVLDDYRAQQLQEAILRTAKYYEMEVGTINRFTIHTTPAMELAPPREKMKPPRVKYLPAHKHWWLKR